MAKIKVKVDFKQLLEDITYTNKVTKNFDVSDIITRGQYYELKDSIVLWLLYHNFTTVTVNGLEYLINKNGEKVDLISLTLTCGDTVCHLHQNLRKRFRKLFNIDPEASGTVEYVFETDDTVEFDETRFRECLSRMKMNRIRFLREYFDKGRKFHNVLKGNLISSDPWMRAYVKLLPLDGRAKITII